MAQFEMINSAATGQNSKLRSHCRQPEVPPLTHHHHPVRGNLGLPLPAASNSPTHRHHCLRQWSLVVLFKWLLVAILAIAGCQARGQINPNGGIFGSTSSMLHHSKQQQQYHQPEHSRLVAMEPAASSIFGSLLGTDSNNVNLAAQQQQSQQLQQQQSASSAAADLHQSYKMGQTSDKVTLPGDILLGGLFPIHMKGTKVECGEINRDRGIQRLEAMLYALDRINEDSEILPEIKLGAILLDSCSSSTYALNQSLEFIRASINTVESSAFECKDKSTPRPKYGSKMIAGVIGGSYSEVSLQVANLLRLFRIPQVSYASTGTALSDKSLYDLFARTVPSDMFQARAIADIVLKLNWSYVSLVSSEGLYGDSGSKEFMKQASVRRICIATHEKVSPTTDNLAYDIIVANLLKRNATGVVLFTRAEDTKELLKAVKRAGLFNNFAWVAADGWGTHQKLIEGVEEVAWGAITVELQAKAIPGFDQYMKGLTPWGNLRNPWFSEYWQEWFNCQLQANLHQQQQVASGANYGGSGGSGSVRRDTSVGTSQLLDYGQQAAGSVDSSQPQPQSSSSMSDYDFSVVRRRSLPDNDDNNKNRKCASNSSNATRPDAASCGNPNMTTTQATPTITTTTTTAKQDEKLQVKPGKLEAGPLSRPKRMATAAAAGQQQQLQLQDQQQQQQMMMMMMKPKQFCSPNLRISESNSYRQEQKVQFVVDAVYAMAHALHKAWYQLCDAKPGVVCEALKELNDLAGSEVKFDEHGDGLGRYNIYNYRQVKPQITSPNGPSRSTSKLAGSRQATSGADGNDSALIDDASSASSPAADGPAMDELENSDSLNGAGETNLDPSGSGSGSGSNQPDADQLPQNQNLGADSSREESIFTSDLRFEYSAIGRWDENEYHLRLEDIEFIQGDRLIPESYCSRPCELGQAKIMRAGDHCCWICKTCSPFEYLPDEFSCRDCGIGRWPIPNKTSCYDLPQKYLRWDSAYSLMSLTIACLGIALTLFVTVIFVKYLDTPVVKASGRELSFILLTGIGFCHMTTFVLLSKPTPFICGSQRFLVNFGFALMYASLLVKTNRISRIFNCARKSAKRPSFISPKSQMLITGILVAIQIFLTIVWFAFESPGIRADSPEGKRDEVILKCRAKGKSFILSLVYNMILITTCTIYAVKTRKIPENFNESKFIGFTMYTTIVIWLAFVTMFFGTNNSYEIQMNTMCVCISLSAYVTLFCLFSPKLSIILLHPDKNVRKLTMNSATYKRPFKPVSSFASVDGRNNTTGTAYYGAQTDGGSGPMSTTSNVLNLATESQAARLVESSIVSNVVNSNSAGSNCSNSQKTPTTLSQQLTLVGACANCGAHQQLTAQAPPPPGTGTGGPNGSGLNNQAAASSKGLDHDGTGPSGSGEGRPASKLPATGSQQQLQQQQNQRHSSGGGKNYAIGNLDHHSHNNHHHHHHHSNTIGRPPTVSTSRSAILVSSSPVGHNKQAGTKAKVLHSKIMSQQQQQQQQQDLTSSGTPTPATLKRISSDDHLLIGCHHNNHQHHRNSTTAAPSTPPSQSLNQRPQRSFSPLTGVHGAAGATAASGPSNSGMIRNGGRHLASLNKLNELNSTTSSDRHGYCIDESISSLANDSLVNTSQENTPCNVPGGGGGGLRDDLHHQHRRRQQGSVGGGPTGSRGDATCYRSAAKLGSDSMLWNQSVYSIDYCSDCCPSYCHCSCQVCSVSNGVSGAGDADDTHGGGQSDTGGAGTGSNATCLHATTGSHHDTELEDYDPMLDCSLMMQEEEEQHSGPLIRRRKSEEPGSRGSGCYYFGGSQATGKLYQNQESASAGHQHHEPSVDRSQQVAAHSGRPLAVAAATGDESSNSSSSLLSRAGRSQTMEMRLVLTSGEPAGKLKQQQHQAGDYPRSSVVTSNQPVVFALQAAATSALGACTASQIVGSLESPQVVANSNQPQANTSNKDKTSERYQQQQQQHHTDKQVAHSSNNRHHQHSGSSSSNNRKQQSSMQPTSGGGGAIQASIELIRTTGQKRSADVRRKHHESSCFTYHDDYEYNYGLVQSNSDSENYCCGDEDSGGDGDTAATSSRRPRRDESDNHCRLHRHRGAGNDYDDEDEYDNEAGDEDRRERDSGDACYDDDEDDGDGDGEDDGDVDDNCDDDFEHDGRVTLNRQRPPAAPPTRSKQQVAVDRHRKRTRRSSVKNRSGSGSGSRRSRQSTSGSKATDHHHHHHQQQFQIDDHRINSVALIAATLSAGGAIVESGGVPGPASRSQQLPSTATGPAPPSGSQSPGATDKTTPNPFSLASGNHQRGQQVQADSHDPIGKGSDTTESSTTGNDFILTTL